MKRAGLNSHALEKLMNNAFALLQGTLPETLSTHLVEKHRLMSLDEALRNIHFPQSPEKLRHAQYRLKFEELFYVQLNILRYTKDRQRKYRGLVFERVGEKFVNSRITTYSLPHNFFAVLYVNAAFNGVAYLAALQVVNIIALCSLLFYITDACNTTCYVNPACVGFKFLF